VGAKKKEKKKKKKKMGLRWCRRAI